jgi:hypothetical protein
MLIFIVFLVIFKPIWGWNNILSIYIISIYLVLTKNKSWISKS